MKRTRSIVTPLAIWLFIAACLPLFAQTNNSPTGGKFGLTTAPGKPLGAAATSATSSAVTNNPPPSPAPPPQGPAASKDLLQGAVIKRVTADAVGMKQGQLGKGVIQCTGYRYDSTKSTDAATGLPTGARKFAPITITKHFDAASIPLMNAFSTNEVLNTVTLSFMGGAVAEVGGVGAGELRAVITVKLTNATITSIHQLYDKDGLAEEVTFAFNRIDVSDSHSSSFTDSWNTK